MSFQNGIKFRSMIEFWEHLPENERVVTDVLRQLVLGTLPVHCKEKLTFNVPYYYGKRRICLIWPASVPWGGIRKGVLFGFCQGNKLQDTAAYLDHGTNKQIFYKVYQSPEDINFEALILLLNEAVALDRTFK